MERILSVLLEEFTDQFPTTADSVPRDIVFPNIPDMIHVAIGMRRSGKTYLLYQTIRHLLTQGVSLDQILFINFEDDRLLPMNQQQLGTLLDAFYTLRPQNHDQMCYLFLDEIQNVEDWPRVIRRFHDTKWVRIFLTGSSAKLLSTEIASSLRGRSMAIEVLPYSFQEFWKAQDIDQPQPPIGKKQLDRFTHHFKAYSSIGGFPAVQHLHENERRTVLQSYVDTVVFRDIIERHRITNVPLIKYLIKTLIKNVAAHFAIHKFYTDLKSQGFEVSKDTAYQYLAYIEDAFLAFTVPLFTESLRKQQLNPKKIYIIDNGLIRANRLEFSSQQGTLFENQVFLDLKRQGKKVAYYQTKEGYEIDFVVEDRDGSMELLQVAWDVSDPKTLERETRALEKAKEELGIKGRLITPSSYLESALGTDYSQ